jgi:nucleoside-diphosphate-sugar epimerase
MKRKLLITGAAGRIGSYNAAHKALHSPGSAMGFKIQVKLI